MVKAPGVVIAGHVVIAGRARPLIRRRGCGGAAAATHCKAVSITYRGRKGRHVPYVVLARAIKAVSLYAALCAGYERALAANHASLIIHGSAGASSRGLVRVGSAPGRIRGSSSLVFASGLCSGGATPKGAICEKQVA